MTLFYNIKTLHDTLLINISNEIVTCLTKKGDVTYLYHDEKLVGINIENVSEKMASISEGYIYLTDFLRKRIENITGIALNETTNNLVIGKIVGIEPIENTHLNICQVDIGNETILQIVCGAANAANNLKVVVALDGCMLPDGKVINAGSLMGHKSQGMLCSYRELNIASDKKGIIELDDESVIGSVYCEAYSNLRLN